MIQLVTAYATFFPICEQQAVIDKADKGVCVSRAMLNEYSVLPVLMRGMPMRIVDYADVPAMFDEVLDEVERDRVTIEVHKDGVSMLRIEPVAEATKALFEEQSLPAE